MADITDSSSASGEPSEKREPSADSPTFVRLTTLLLVIPLVITIAVALFRFGIKELGVSLIGLALPVAQSFDRWMLGRKRSREAKIEQKRIVGPLWPVTVAWVTAYAAGYLTPSVAARLSSPEISVHLYHSGTARPTEVVEVTWARLPENTSPEIFVYSVQLKLYFPQRCGLPQSKEGRQQCRVEFGPGSAGHEYEIVTVAADARARQDLVDYAGNLISSGMPWLPPSAQRISSFEVRT